MAEIILHQHDPSPYAEKIRKAFGVKNIAWKSVQIPMVMPKPDLTALTGGYRGTPVMQIGADIYCDSRRIIAEIERRFPTPPLFASGPLINFGLQHWSDEVVFPAGAALALHLNAAHIPKEVTEDRAAYFSELDFGRFSEDAPHFLSQFAAHAALIDAQLADGRAFLCGERPEWADLGAWLDVWMADTNFPSANEIFTGLGRLPAWRDRMAALGVGSREDIDAAAALDIARDAAPSDAPSDAAASAGSNVDLSGAAPGDDVSVAPPGRESSRVVGQLAFISRDEIIIKRDEARIGEVAVHFPRIGYRVDRLN